MLSTADNADTGYVLESDVKNTDTVKKLSLNFSFCPENRIIPVSEQIREMKSTKLRQFCPNRRIICVHLDKEKNLP